MASWSEPGRRPHGRVPNLVRRLSARVQRAVEPDDTRRIAIEPPPVELRQDSAPRRIRGLVP
jgi:hypothetical protein